VLQDEPLVGLPRVYGVAWAFVAHTDSAFDEELLVRFLQAYQEARELTLGELWALPTTLRVVLIENLRRLAERVAANKAARELANLCADRLDAYPPERLDAVLAVLNRRGVGETFLAQIAQRLQDPRAEAEHAAREWLGRVAPQLAEIQTRLPAAQAADNLSTGNAITSLRSIGDADWPDIVGRTSVLMQLMMRSPAFAAERDDTRDRTLHAVEKLARKSGRSERTVAAKLLELMHGAEPADDGGDDDPKSVAAYWLLGAGQDRMLAAIGLRESHAWQRRTRLRRLALPVYLGAVALATGTIVAWLLLRHSAALAPSHAGTSGALAALLMLVPASEAAADGSAAPIR
jgi:cyclic beta-1,2-glucan synthetase